MTKQTLAQVDIGTQFGQNFLGNPPTSIGDVFGRVIPTVFVIALITVVLYFIWGSYKYLMSGGDPKSIAAARQQMTWAAAGMAIMFMSYWIFQIVNSLVFNTYGI